MQWSLLLRSVFYFSSNLFDWFHHTMAFALCVDDRALSLGKKLSQTTMSQTQSQCHKKWNPYQNREKFRASSISPSMYRRTFWTKATRQIFEIWFFIVHSLTEMIWLSFAHWMKIKVYLFELFSRPNLLNKGFVFFVCELNTSVVVRMVFVLNYLPAYPAC